MRFLRRYLHAAAVVLLLVTIQFSFSVPASAEPDDPKLANKRCLMCHGRDGFSREDAFGQLRDLHVDAERFDASVHVQRLTRFESGVRTGTVDIGRHAAR